MAIDHSAIEHLAHLARIDSANSQETQSLQADLNHIMEMIDKILVANTEHINPMAHPYEVSQPLREDSVTESNHRDEWVKLAPASEAGLFLVPKILE